MQHLKSSFFERFAQLASSSQSLTVEHTWEVARSLLIHAFFKAQNKHVVVIASGHAFANLQADLVALCGKEHFIELPALGTSPEASNPDLLGKCLNVCQTLYSAQKPHLILTTLSGFLQKIPSPDSIHLRKLSWSCKTVVPFLELDSLLSQMGYTRVAQVTDKGQFAKRGCILDLFPINTKEPCRFEFEDDTIATIRFFDPIAQTSIGTLSEVEILPASGKESTTLDLILKEKMALVLEEISLLEDSWVEIGSPPLFTQIFKPELPLLIMSETGVEALSETRAAAPPGRDYYTGKAPLQPVEFEMFNHKFSSSRLHMPLIPLRSFLEAEAETSKEIWLSRLINKMTPQSTLRLLARSLLEKQSMEKELAPYSPFFPKNSSYSEGYLSAGFVIPEEELFVLPDTELNHRPMIIRDSWRRSYHTPVSEYHKLEAGDLVVHYQHGIGTYLGVEKANDHLGESAEFLSIQYADGAILFVPSTQTHLVSRYVSATSHKPDLHTLGSKKWQNLRQKTETAIIGYAQQLLNMEALRQIHGGFVYPEDSALMHAFEEDFPYEETEDQLRAIMEIKQDMLSDRPMDRLLCGDVGYGKTEVAMRAAFKAVIDGHKQVALLVPTTLLAIQHTETFKARMNSFPIEIATLCRITERKELKKKIAQIHEGKIDIVIGTHRLLQEDVKFFDLGLIIIDEEQRFGVRAKEKLRSLKLGVDTLTLSATPIPRTLYLSLIKLRQISLIHSPPQDRLPIRTVIAPYNEEMIRQAIVRELSRGGQVFFIHNRVETIHSFAEKIALLCPSAKYAVAHGQMDSRDLDHLFSDFREGRTDILFATSLIESGIDVPNANTILVDRADRFGIADLYQIRGRVGRWNRLAYAYFMTSDKQKPSPEAKARLDALAGNSGFGGGMRLAMKDLELRGAGDILGEMQSGHVSQIGYHLYCRLLRKAVESLGKNRPAHFIETKIEGDITGSIPDSYISDTALKLEIYHRLGECSSLKAIDALLEELKDRFGKPPKNLYWLYHLTRLRFKLSEYGFTSLKFKTPLIEIECTVKGKSIKRTLIGIQIQKPEELETLLFPKVLSAYGIRHLAQ